MIYNGDKWYIAYNVLYVIDTVNETKFYLFVVKFKEINECCI